LAESPIYDAAIIGSGPGGYVAAIRAGQLGLKTVLVEKDDRFGGTCLQVGCIPTKALLLNAEVFEYFKNAKEYGIDCPGFSLDWSAVLARKARIVNKHTKGVEFLLKKNHVETVRGSGRLAGPSKINVADLSGQAREIAAKKIILATGSEARMLPGLEADAKAILTNIEVLDLKVVPKSMVIIGAGAVGVEFASIFHRFGTKVTLLETLPRAVPVEDEEISAELEKAFRKQGITLHTSARVEKVAKTSQGVSVEFTASGPPQGQPGTQGGQAQAGKAGVIQSETCLVAVGRVPNTRNLGIETTRIKLDRGFIKVDSNMQTEEPGIYAIGDIVAASPQLAHVASMGGLVAAAHAAGKPIDPINYLQVPNCTYCEPEISSVGLTESRAREAGHQVRVSKFPFSANSKATILSAREGFVKIVSEQTYGEILGVHMIGPRVTEMIAEVVVAMRLEGTVADLAHTIHAHPTLTEALAEAAHAAADGMAIHI
jgi:dihydrolipoamide dehydrogenase